MAEKLAQERNSFAPFVGMSAEKSIALPDASRNRVCAFVTNARNYAIME